MRPRGKAEPSIADVMSRTAEAVTKRTQSQRGKEGQRNERAQTGAAFLSSIAILAGLVGLFLLALVFTFWLRAPLLTRPSDSSAARNAADAGAWLAIRHLIALQRQVGGDANPLAGNNSLQCMLPDGSLLNIEAASEFGKIDINTADRAYLHALFRGLGATPGTADAIMDRLEDYLDPDNVPRTDGAEAATYKAAGLAWGPRNGPVDSVEELNAVWGLPSEFVQRAMPHLTVFAARKDPDMERATTQLSVLLKRGGIPVSSGGAQALQAQQTDVKADRDVMSIRISAVHPSGARFTRTAVVELSTAGRQSYRLRRWTQANEGDSPAIVTAAESPNPCYR